MLEFRRLPTLTQLRHLIAVDEHRHFGRAAAACFVTQSSFSASIKELESTLGKVLIERTRRSVQVTPLGAAVVERARRVLVDVAELADLVSASGAPLSGDLRLGVIQTISPFLLPRVLPDLRRAYPDLKLYLREERSAELVERLGGGELDLALLAFPYPTGKLETRVFADDPFWAALPRGHQGVRRERLTPADLADERLLLEEGNCLRDHAMDACGLAGDGGTPEFQGSSLHTLVQMTANGLGVTLLPKMAIDAGITKGTRLQLRPLEGKGTSRRIGFAWRKSSPRTEEFDVLAAFFQAELATPLPPGKIA